MKWRKQIALMETNNNHGRYERVLPWWKSVDPRWNGVPHFLLLRLLGDPDDPPSGVLTGSCTWDATPLGPIQGMGWSAIFSRSASFRCGWITVSGSYLRLTSSSHPDPAHTWIPLVPQQIGRRVSSKTGRMETIPKVPRFLGRQHPNFESGRREMLQLAIPVDGNSAKCSATKRN